MNNTKITGALVAVAILSTLVVSPVFAQSATGTKARQDAMEKRDEKR